MNSVPEIAHSPLRTRYGDFVLYVFSWGENEQENVLVLEKQPVEGLPLIRIQSACYTGEIFESSDCDCHWQLEAALQLIQESGGYFIYMLKDGRGAGLLTKIRGLNLTETEGLDTAQAYRALGISLDPRSYEMPVWILNHFRVKELNLLTNNPRKVEGLESAGFVVHRIEHESKPTSQNKSYLRAKKEKLGHLFKNV